MGSPQRTVAAVIVLALLAAAPPAAARQMPPPAPPPPGEPPAAPPRPAESGLCTARGQVLGPSDFGVAAGLPVADASAVLLPDGRVRLYVFAQNRGIVSAVSVSTDGLTFTAEPGLRLPDGSGMPRVVRTTSGYRLFFTSAGGISSAISTDGLSFTVEPGQRITKDAAGFGASAAGTSGAAVIRLADGRYRMYFSDLPRPGDPPGNHRVKTAVSPDMLAWTVEAGIIAGPGAATLTESSEHPFALINPDGSVTMYYGRFAGPGGTTPEGLYQSTSRDGLTFAEETYNIFMANDPDALRLSDGTLLVYYGLFDPQVGGTINVAQCVDPGAAAPVARR
jgi:hypothetical protein